MNTPQRVDVERFTVYGDASIRRSENGNFVKHEAYADLLQQLAERDAEIERLWDALALANDQLAEQCGKTEAAERARDESIPLLDRSHSAALSLLGMLSLGGINDGREETSALINDLAAFLAANGGRDHA